MGIFNRQPSQAEIRAFGRNRSGSGKAAAAYAQQQRDKLATRKALAQRRAAQKKGK